ncbi:GntR family transcriptional regulator [Phenylobacterium sp.]|uniref:GntR family transcriptional regulator n=1 Tax=Phenylobacterium sp. TaxID=1871053 RepID=UPI003457A700
MRAILSGELPIGSPFPSVRAIAADLQVHPNTAMKVTQRLIAEGWLVSRPGIGTLVATPPEARQSDRARLLDLDVEKLAVEALRVGLTLEELVAAIRERWAELKGGQA